MGREGGCGEGDECGAGCCEVMRACWSSMGGAKRLLNQRKSRRRRAQQSTAEQSAESTRTSKRPAGSRPQRGERGPGEPRFRRAHADRPPLQEECH